MALQIRRGQTRSFGKMIAASFAIMAIVLQPLVQSNIPAAFATDNIIDTQAELVAAIAGSASTIDLGGSFTIASQVSINRTLTLNGNGYTLTAQSGWTGSGSNDTVLAVTAGSPTINNIVIDGANAVNVQGLQVWRADATLNNITSRNNDKAGIHVNGLSTSVVTISNAHTSNNGSNFGGIMVSGGKAIIAGQSIQSENTNWTGFKMDIYRTGGTVNDVNSQYGAEQKWLGFVPTGIRIIKSAPVAPTITSPVSGSTITSDGTTVNWTAPTYADHYLVSVDGAAVTTVSGTSTTVSGLATGTHIVTVQSVAKSGLAGGIATTTFTVPDTTAPTADSEIKGGEVVSGTRYVRPSDTLTYKISNAQDSESGVKNVKWTVFKLDKDANGKTIKQHNVCNGWTNAAFVNNVVSKSFKINDLCDKDINGKVADGYYGLALRVYDNADNNLRIDNKEFVVDRTSPVVSDFKIDNQATKYAKSITASVLADDVNLKDVNFYVTEAESTNTNGSLKCTGNGAHLISQTVSTLVNGRYVATLDTSNLTGNNYCVSVRAADLATNHSNVAGRTLVTIDNTAPKLTSVTLNKTNTANGMNYTSSKLNSGVLDVTFTTDEPLKLVGSQVSFGLPVAPALGWTKVELVDASTNKYVAHMSLTNRTDTSNINNYLVGKQLDNVQLYFRLVDTLSNTKSTYYAQDVNGNLIEGWTTNSNDSRNYKFTLDNVKPTISIDTPATDGEVVNDTASVKVTARDGAALKSVVVHLTKPDGTYATNNTCLWKTHSVNGQDAVIDCDLSGYAMQGAYSLTVAAVDQADNATFATRTFKLDSMKPVVAITSAPDGVVSSVNSYKVSQYVTVNVDELNLGTTKVYKADGTEVQSYTSSNFTLTSGLPEGEYYLVHTDQANNQSNVVRFVISRTAPVLENLVVRSVYSGTSSTDQNLNFGVNENGGSDIKNVRIAINTYDATKGNNRGAQVYNDYNYTANADGTYTLDLKPIINSKNLQDGQKYVLLVQAGNTAGVHDTEYFTFTVDNSAPDLSITGASLNAQGTYTINGTTDDPTSPIGVTVDGTLLTGLTLNGNNWSVNTGVLLDGAHTVVVTSVDAVGNDTTETYSFKTEAGNATIDNLNDTDTPDDSALNGGNNAGGTGDDAGEVEGASDAKQGTVEGASTTKNADNAAKASGMASWFWWILAAAAASFVWWLIAAARKRKSEE